MGLVEGSTNELPGCDPGELCSLCSVVILLPGCSCGSLAKAALSKPLGTSQELVLHPLLPANISNQVDVFVACPCAPQDVTSPSVPEGNTLFSSESGIRRVFMAACGPWG